MISYECPRCGGAVEYYEGPSRLSKRIDKWRKGFRCTECAWGEVLDESGADLFVRLTDKHAKTINAFRKAVEILDLASKDVRDAIKIIKESD